MKHIFLFLILPLYGVCYAEAVRTRKTTESDVVCTFKEKEYRPGDSWHPYLEPFGLMFCMRCVCTETGHVKCNTIKCPVVRCEHPITESQQCCPRCADERRTPAGLRAPVKTCRYNGSQYQTGETFANYDLFPSRQTNQCVMCTCSDGNIFCALKTCLPLTCSTPVPVPDTCCLMCNDSSSTANSASAEEGGQQLNRGVAFPRPLCWRTAAERQVCPGHSVHSAGLTEGCRPPEPPAERVAGTTVKILLQKNQQKACVYSGRTYSHGDVWHPVLGKVLECIVCTCRDGVQECKRITCPNQYPCQHPEKAEGKCCKTCPELKAESNRTQCGLGQNSNSLLVYKVEPSSEADTQDTIRVIAVEKQGANVIEVHVWKTVEGVLHLAETWDLQKKDLAEHPENYVLLTTVDEESWAKFKENEKKRKEFLKTQICEGESKNCSNS